MLSSTNNFTKALKALNSSQKAAVETIEGPVMVLAGPGTGKTQVVALRIANILQKTQLGPQNILALTFTDAGVTALRQRLSQVIGPLAYRVTIATFHSFANEVIGIFPHLFTHTQTLRQITDPDRYLLIEEIIALDKALTELRPLRKPDLYVAEISARIKTCKQEAVKPERLKKLIAALKSDQQSPSAKHRQKEFVTVLQRYNEELTKRGWYDYEDTIQFVVEALRHNDEVRSYFQERYQYMLVDEYQDTNNSQNALVEALADFYPDPNLFVVGDDKQAIYRFQGASVANMLHFKRRYPRMKVIFLSDNYRSTPEILQVATRLIDHNRKQIQSLLQQPDRPLIARNQSDKQAEIIKSANKISQYSATVSRVKIAVQAGCALTEIAVLFRRRQAAKEFSELAKKSGLIISGQIETDLFNHPVTQSVWRLLTAIDQPTNNIATIAALRPLLTDRSLLQLYKINRTSRSETALIEKLALVGGELGRLAKALLELHRQAETLTTEELIHQLLDKYQFLQQRIFSRHITEATGLLLSLLNLAGNFSKHSENANLTGFLAHCQMIKTRQLEVPIVELLPDTGLFVGTVHSAKGLEFERVIMADVDERNWSLKAKPELIKLPGGIVELTDWEDDPVEDERRLFYVGITRAKKELTLSYAQQGDDGRDQLPSQFLLELGDLTAQTVNLTSSQARSINRQVLGDGARGEAIAKTTQAYLHQLATSSPFSYSDLRAFQTCPQQYLLARLLRLPQPISEALMYGSAVHRALELYFREYRAFKKKPSSEKFLEMIEESVIQTVWPSYQENILAHATGVLEQYWAKYAPSWTAPVGIEYSFTHHHVRYGDIWLTGKFDRIDLLDGKTKAVRVVDYKTKSRSLTRNEIVGKTQSGDTTIWQQLVFYAFLAKHDPLFPYHIGDFLVSVIDDKGEFRDEVVAVTPDDIREMEKLVASVHSEILASTTFRHTRASFDKGCEICQTYGNLT